MEVVFHYWNGLRGEDRLDIRLERDDRYWYVATREGEEAPVRRWRTTDAVTARRWVTMLRLTAPGSPNWRWWSPEPDGGRERRGSHYS